MNMKITRRGALQTIAGLATSAVVARPYVNRASAQENLKGTGEVVVYDGGGAWGEAQRYGFFEPFEKETGIKVIAAAQMPVGPMRASVLAGAPAYDVTNVSGGQVDAFVAENLLEKIDYSYFRPGDREDYAPVKPTDYLLPTAFYAIVVAYDKEAFGGDKPQTWADVWNAEKFPGKRSLYNAGDDVVIGAVLEAALLADGVAPKDVYPIDFKRAFASLDKIKPHVLRYWSTGAEAVQLLTDGSVTVTSSYNGRIAALKEQNVPVDLSWNQAILLWDGWAVLRGAKNRENAMKFLAYVAQPEPQARFSEKLASSPSNPKAFQFLTPERIAMLPGNPENVANQLVQDYTFWNGTDANGKSNVQVATEMWQAWVSN